MLQSSFLHLPGIGENTERALWEQGVRDWDTFEEVAHEVLGAKKTQKCLVALEESRAALDAGDFGYFQKGLGGRNAWRLIPFCEEHIAYLDIETTGLGFPPASESTTVAVAFRDQLYVEHERSKKEALFEFLENEAKMWVTFNGASFDLPFLRNETGRAFAQAHVDLRIWFARHGIKGGLKKIQASLPQVRARSSMDIDGFDAVRLWRMHKRGVPGALETLMTYNAEDTVVLQSLVDVAWQMELDGHQQFGLQARISKPQPVITTQVHESVYDILRGRDHWDVPPGW